MRKEFFLVVVFLLVKLSSMSGQGSYVISHVWDNEANRSYYVGSLSENSGNLYQRLKVDVFGGNFTHNTASADTYFINTRGTNDISIERRNGSPSDSYQLKVFKNGTNYDFVIQINNNYVNLLVQSWLFNGPLDQITAAKPIDIIKYNPSGKTDVTASFNKIIFIASDKRGNIGIGTLSPKAKLDVRGTVRAKEVKIEMNAGEGADFVFEQDYNLRPLSEVEAFINENKHLPEVPSEKQMTEDGLDMSKMQIKLLQKIEEMTLYIIQQQKQLDEQDRKNASLEEKIKGLQEIIERQK